MLIFLSKTVKQSLFYIYISAGWTAFFPIISVDWNIFQPYAASSMPGASYGQSITSPQKPQIAALTFLQK